MAHSIPRVDMMDGGGGGASRGKRDAERETGSVSDQGAVTPAFYLLESGRNDTDARNGSSHGQDP